ncbi:helicase-related protein [Sphingosinicellaceae bacterium M-36]
MTKITAVLGPTNTGKTHLAVERLCAHASGMMGFPLRLLAREVYDRVVAIKGAAQVALITGEERILPPDARYFLCTAESMPLERDVGFVALDEAQMGATDERGHIFTDRLLRARGRDETMILGSDSLRPLVARLVPEAEIIARPRFSTLSYMEPRKLSRLPKRSAIVAFSTEQVYAIGEMLRRQRGGVAVVMGSLSPRTRNAQVAMYQSGEVDYLVATDAIGMGLNMDIAHVAFAGLHKFDGRRHRRLTPAEMAQIAGRAGRHQRDGTFGAVQFEEGRGFTPEEVVAIEGHSFQPLQSLRWRNANLDFSSVDGLLRSLDRRPDRPELSRADDAVDLAVLRLLAQEADVAARTTRPARVRRLWDACQIPDYRKVSPEIHARLVGRIFRHLSEGRGTLPTDWVAGEVARLDATGGDIETIAGRIAGIRTWAYVAQRADWLDDPKHWAERTRAVEDKLSDVLHERLIQRFVDRRTSILLREAGGRHAMGIEVAADGSVEVEGQAIGTLSGFTFTVDPATRHDDRRRVMAAAERVLSAEMGRRARALASSDEEAFTLDYAPVSPHGRILWRGALVATLAAGRCPLSPQIRLEPGAAGLCHGDRASIAARLSDWLDSQIDQHLGPLKRLAAVANGHTSDHKDGKINGAARGLAVQLVQGLGIAPRDLAEAQIKAMSREERRWVARAGVRLGTRHLFVPGLLKPLPTRWRLALWAAANPGRLTGLPREGAVTIVRDPVVPEAFYTVAGYWPVVDKAIRVDVVERLLQALRDAARQDRTIVPPDSLVSMVGLSRPDFARLMMALGYGRATVPEEVAGGDGPVVAAFRWRGDARRKARPVPVPARADSPFSVLAPLRGGGV